MKKKKKIIDSLQLQYSVHGIISKFEPYSNAGTRSSYLSITGLGLKRDGILKIVFHFYKKAEAKLAQKSANEQALV